MSSLPSPTALSTAAERLLESRERLRRSMQRPSQRPSADPVPALAAAGARVLLAPVASRHPLVLVGGAVALGALLVWYRPWRRTAAPAGTSQTMVRAPTAEPALMTGLLLSGLSWLRSASAGRQAAPSASKKA
jgi:hypothetical protein